MAPRLYRDQGIVLRSIRLGEADRIVTVFTQNNGRVRAVAKGIRKMKSRFGARLDAFTHVDLLVYRGRDLDIINQAEIVGRFPRLRAHYPSFTAAAAMADAVERTTPEQERNVRLFVQLRNGLRALEAGAAQPALLAHAFLAKSLGIAGLEPTLGVCVSCGSSERVGFSHGAGGAVCGSCVERSDPPAAEATLDAWVQLQRDEWDALRVRSMHPAQARELARLLLDFCQWQVDNRLRAFGMLATGPDPTPA